MRIKMKNRRFITFLITAAFGLSACNGKTDPNRLIIENFKSGLLCPNPSSGEVDPKHHRHTCFETEYIVITGQGQCPLGQDELPCTWYGFEFDYKNAQPDQNLYCTVKTEYTETFGKQKKIANKPEKAHEYVLKLNASDTHLFYPQYTLFNPSSETTISEIQSTTCSDGSREVINYTQTLIYPEKNRKTAD